MCRLVIGPPLVYKTLVCPDNEIIVKAGGFGILAVSVMWGWKIIMMMVKELKKLLGRGRREEGLTRRASRRSQRLRRGLAPGRDGYRILSP